MSTEITHYRDLLADIKVRVRTAQHKAALSANAEMILMYWDIGRLIAARQEREAESGGGRAFRFRGRVPPDANRQAAQDDEGAVSRLKLREIIRKASGETIDLKSYEADMRHLIDTYIEAKEPRKISNFDDIGLLELIVKSGMGDAIKSLPDGIKGSKGAVAEILKHQAQYRAGEEAKGMPGIYRRPRVDPLA